MADNFLVTVKSVDSDSTPVLDFVNDLSPGETLTSVTLLPVLPATTPTLDATISGADRPTRRTVTLSGGQSGKTYNVRLQVVTSTRTFMSTLAVQVQDNVFNQLRTRNPAAFQTLLEEIEVGEVGIGKGIFTLPAGRDVSTGSIVWELLDQDGSVYSSGNAFDYKVTNTSLVTRLEGSGLVNVPSDTPTTLSGQRYQVRWQLVGVGPEPIYAYENLRVIGRNTVPEGAGSVVEMENYPALLELIVPVPFDDVALDVIQGNSPIRSALRPTISEPTENGWYYAIKLDTTGLLASLDPYSVVWRYRNTFSGNSTETFNVEHGELYIVNATIMRAIDSVQHSLMKARGTLLNMQDVLFDSVTVLNWLQRGRDTFNGAGGKFTTFTMVNATGAIRSFWLGYSEVDAARAHALAEGEKSFNFSGQAISLDRDVAQYYQTWASDKLSELDNAIAMFKTNLIKRGITGGDGDINSASGKGGHVAKLGMALTPMTRFGRFRGFILR